MKQTVEVSRQRASHSRDMRDTFRTVPTLSKIVFKPVEEQKKTQKVPTGTFIHSDIKVISFQMPSSLKYLDSKRCFMLPIKRRRDKKRTEMKKNACVNTSHTAQEYNNN